jgi:hypothetical protein
MSTETVSIGARELREWTPIAESPPAEGIVVRTCIIASAIASITKSACMTIEGVTRKAPEIAGPYTKRMEQDLQRIGNLWFLADGSMYVYYTPTHWRMR